VLERPDSDGFSIRIEPPPDGVTRKRQRARRDDKFTTVGTCRMGARFAWLVLIFGAAGARAWRTARDIALH
jgi:hypothetical protein